MKESIVKRTLEEAEHILCTGATVRETATAFDVSKSTVHKDVSERLKYVNADLWREVKKILDFNLAERHIRGGNATKNKYLRRRD
ncbi:MAG: sporulation transcriptional regulator SpoIIID [Christensenellales bacterium]